MGRGEGVYRASLCASPGKPATWIPESSLPVARTVQGAARQFRLSSLCPPRSMGYTDCPTAQVPIYLPHAYYILLLFIPPPATYSVC